MLKISIKNLMRNKLLSVRTYSLLNNAGYKEISELEQFSYEEIYFIRNCGHVTTKEILNVIQLIKKFNSIEELFKTFEIKNLKERAEELHNINTKIKSSKATKLLILALNRGCSYGELKNCVV